MQLQEENKKAIVETADQFLTFMLGEEEYGVEILKVQEIKSWGPYTPLPKSPEHVLGVINLRGAIVPMIDLRCRFDLPSVEYTSTTAIIIVRSVVEEQIRIIGLVVDRVSEVYHLDNEAIQETSDATGLARGEYIRGFGQTEDKMVILINLDPIVESSLESGGF
ncbi:MAG: chemotaxis protein CheW [Granulosicoccaceae bacterium]